MLQSRVSDSISIAVITDVHGNSLALEAVLAQIEQQKPDLILNLGDQVWGQVDPLAAYELQAGLGAIEVRGNNDEKPFLTDELADAAGASFSDWLRARVPEPKLRRLSELPTTASVAGGRVMAAHGTPTSPWENLLWKLEAGKVVPKPEHEVTPDLASVAAEVEVVLVGHSHWEATARVGGKLLVNAGPVSWQFDGDPRARWTLVESRAGAWNVSRHRVVYDWNEAARLSKMNDPVFKAEADFLLGK